MARFTRGLVVTLGFVLLGFFITMIPQRTALGQNGNSQPVIVKNTPLPTTVTNTPLPVTGNLSVGNFPATQNVAVTNTPLPVSGTVTAQIANTPVPVSGTVGVSSLPPLTVGITPNATTHVLQSVGQLIQFDVFTQGFIQIDNTGATVGTTFYTVPAGQVLILTDYEWHVEGTSTTNGIVCSLLGLQAGFGFRSCAMSDSNGNAAGSEHLTTGVVIGPGVMPTGSTGGSAQGYLIATQ